MKLNQEEFISHLKEMHDIKMKAFDTGDYKLVKEIRLKIKELVAKYPDFVRKKCPRCGEQKLEYFVHRDFWCCMNCGKMVGGKVDIIPLAY